MHGDYFRKSKREQESLQDRDLPYLWILASSASENLLNGFGASASEDWGSGVYFFSSSFKTAVIAINQLPCNEATLLLRILGKGQTQKQAVSEILAFNVRDPRRSAMLKLLTNWKISIEITGQAEAEKEFIMALAPRTLSKALRSPNRAAAKGTQLSKDYPESVSH